MIYEWANPLAVATVKVLQEWKGCLKIGTTVSGHVTSGGLNTLTVVLQAFELSVWPVMFNKICTSSMV